jgi:transcriptional regulator with PAS, ATPase and Fis domain
LSAELLRRSQWAFDTFGTVTRSAHLLGMLEEVASVAVSNLPVLILGESGTGKELVAHGVHALSGRTGEFVAINCSAVPEAMLEGEFFGYMRGSFTNAVADKPGLLEVAHEGTVFLDEIGEMSVDLQAKLLRFLETGSLRRVGATRDTNVETRIVAATNRDRAGLQGGNGFRSDLYYRLAHAVYELPPLRERGDDVELLLDHFLEHFSRENGRAVRLTPAVRSRLLGHPWPGNVRELRSVVNKLVVSARPDGVVTPRELPPLEAATVSAATRTSGTRARRSASFARSTRRTSSRRTPPARCGSRARRWWAR